jgi:hypothetical protein
MGYVAGLLAVLSIAVGMKFRLKILLVMLALVFIASFIFVIAIRLDFVNAFFTILGLQALCQVGYFAGMVIRRVAEGSGRLRLI